MRFHLIAAFAALTIGATHATALTADFGADFTISSNPNGVWTYGYTNSLGGGFIAHSNTLSTATHQGWYTEGVEGASLFKNITGSTINGLAGGMSGMHSGQVGQFAVARYTSSEAGLVDIEGYFGAGDFGTVGCYVLVDGVSVFGIADASSDAVFSVTTNLNVGSTVDFMVNEGFGNYAFDTTPLQATIESVPEPATMAVFGIAGLLAARRRRK